MEANKNAEQVAITLSKTIRVIGIILGIILIVAGIAHISNSEEEVGFPLIFGGLAFILSTLMTWAVINVLVNISLKLDNRSVVIHSSSMSEISKMIVKQSDEPLNVISTPSSKPKEEVTPLPKVKESTDNKVEVANEIEIENEVLGVILSGNTIGARHLLMTQKNMSMKQADAYIAKLKSDIEINN